MSPTLPTVIAGRAQLEDTLPVSEVFGPVWQGEGPHAGQLCAFLRLGLCNLACSWCDTPYTWDTSRYDVAEECPPRTPESILRALQATGAPLVVLSGGEPLMHQRKKALLDVLERDPFRRWHVETNGTLAPTAALVDRVEHFTVSPKIATSDPLSKRIKPKVLTEFAELAWEHKAAWKVVVRNVGDVRAAHDLFEEFNVPQFARWAMPEGITADQVLSTGRAVAQSVLDHRMNYTLRQHTLLYGTERAR